MNLLLESHIKPLTIYLFIYWSLAQLKQIWKKQTNKQTNKNIHHLSVFSSLRDCSSPTSGLEKPKDKTR